MMPSHYACEIEESDTGYWIWSVYYSGETAHQAVKRGGAESYHDAAQAAYLAIQELKRTDP